MTFATFLWKLHWLGLFSRPIVQKPVSRRALLSGHDFTHNRRISNKIKRGIAVSHSRGRCGLSARVQVCGLQGSRFSCKTGVVSQLVKGRPVLFKGSLYLTAIGLDL